MIVKTTGVASGLVDLLFSPASGSGPFAVVATTTLALGGATLVWTPPSYPGNYPADVFYVAARVKDSEPVSHYWPYQSNSVPVLVDFTP